MIDSHNKDNIKMAVLQLGDITVQRIVEHEIWP